MLVVGLSPREKRASLKSSSCSTKSSSLISIGTGTLGRRGGEGVREGGREGRGGGGGGGGGRCEGGREGGEGEREGGCVCVCVPFSRGWKIDHQLLHEVKILSCGVRNM